MQVIVGVNKYTVADETPPPVRIIDNTAVLNAQVAKLKHVKQSRDSVRAAKALDGVRAAAADPSINLLGELAPASACHVTRARSPPRCRSHCTTGACIEAAKARCTLGEMCSAMETVFGRHAASVSLATGAYTSEYGNDAAEVATTRQLVQAFADKHGRRPRILVAKMGQDGHDRGQKVISTGFADLGFDVDVGPLFSTPEEVAKHALESDVHIVGISTLAAGHKTLVPALVQSLKAAGAGDIVVVAGGVIPHVDYPALLSSGCSAGFGPGTRVPVAARAVLALVDQAQS